MVNSSVWKAFSSRTFAKLGHISLIIILLLGFLIVAAPRSFAADDSNSGQLTQSQTVNPQLLSSTIGNLTAGLNNTQVAQLTSQLQSQLSSGNTTGASQTLASLQNLLSTQSGSQGVPDSLSSLLKSLTAGPNGISLNASQLSNLLGLDSSNGMPTNISNQSPASAAQALQALSFLLKNINPAMAQQLLSEASAILQNAGTNTGLTPPTLPNGQQGLPAINPAIKPPSLSTVPVAKLPSINASTLEIPLIVVALVIALYFSRTRFFSTIGRQMLPGQLKPLDTTADLKYDPNDPKSRILYTFARAVGIMRIKGFEKFTFESHREFAKKCLPSIESSHVSAISALYEKAKFSGTPVPMSDADQAARELSSIEVSRT
ncbi:MAG: hypothetical protein ACYCPW_00485 [Nitrososphaerales archaeon]